MKNKYAFSLFIALSFIGILSTSAFALNQIMSTNNSFESSLASTLIAGNWTRKWHAFPFASRHNAGFFAHSGSYVVKSEEYDEGYISSVVIRVKNYGSVFPAGNQAQLSGYYLANAFDGSNTVRMMVAFEDQNGIAQSFNYFSCANDYGQDLDDFTTWEYCSHSWIIPSNIYGIKYEFGLSGGFADDTFDSVIWLDDVVAKVIE